MAHYWFKTRLPYKKLLLRRKLVWLKRTEGINMALQSKNRQIIAVAIKAAIIKTSQIYPKIPKMKKCYRKIDTDRT